MPLRIDGGLDSSQCSITALKERDIIEGFWDRLFLRKRHSRKRREDRRGVVMVTVDKGQMDRFEWDRRPVHQMHSLADIVTKGSSTN
ncbi:hypothetical protein TNCV_3808271 [Trichonephila clavipes]|nr:hypothetical protein TNCV_3808271 [Trichonephila clavipes]